MCCVRVTSTTNKAYSPSRRDALANISELDAIMGKFSFNADSDGVYELNVLIVRNGRLQLFDEYFTFDKRRDTVENKGV